MSAYDLDLHAWAFAQADALRRRSANEVDWENVAEEIESLGRQTRWELRNRLLVLITHLLKWAYQPNLQTTSWRHTIREQRRAIARLMKESPSLKSSREEIFCETYDDSILSAVKETGLQEEIFPKSSPFSLEQTLDDTFWPEPVRLSQSPN